MHMYSELECSSTLTPANQGQHLYLQFGDLGPVFYESRTLHQQETKMDRKTLPSQPV